MKKEYTNCFLVFIMGLKQVERRIRVMQLRCSGYTEVQIADVLGVSERTVRRDLRSSAAEDFVCEFKRRQFKDIEECEDLKMRLDFRDKMLNKLMPKKVNQTIQGGKTPFVLRMWKPEEEETKDERNK